MKAPVSVRVIRLGGVCASVLALYACVNEARFPSLARRAAETAGAEATPAPIASTPTVTATPTATDDTSAKLAKLSQTARTAHASFAARRAAGERAVAGAGPLGSESWANASVALAALEEAHDRQTAALAEIDQLEVERQMADAGADGPDVAAILAARDAIANAADEDGAVLTRLRARLAG